MNKLRWLLAAPAAIFGWYLGLFAVSGGYMLIESLCPSEHVVSGMCFASWVPLVGNILLAFGSVVAGVMTVLLATLVAPGYKGRVALTAYMTGLVGSIYWAKHGYWLPVVCAAIGGGICLWLIYIVLTKRIDKTVMGNNPFVVLWYRIPDDKI